MQSTQTTIRVNMETKEKLSKIAGYLQTKKGKKVSYDEAINFLIEQYEIKKIELKI